MMQVLLVGTGQYEGEVLVVWVPRGTVGETVKWNGSPWRISAQYGTHFCADGFMAKRSEKPRESPLERFS